MAYYRGKGWPAWRIARKIGFCLRTVQQRLALMGWANKPGPQRVGENLLIVGGYSWRNGEWHPIDQIDLNLE
jgi:hypothetical protein